MNSTDETFDIEEKYMPPLGVKPAYMVHRNRIYDLCGAILRYSENLTVMENRILIKKWANEIIALCEYNDY